MSKAPDRRIWFLSVFATLVLGVLILRLFHLQVVRFGYFNQVAETQRQRSSELAPHRGTVYLSEGEDLFPAATNQKAWIAYAVPREIDNPKDVADKLAPELLAWRNRQQARIEAIIKASGQKEPEPEEEEGEQSEEEDLPEEEEMKTEEEQNEEALDILRQELFDKFNKKTDPYEPLLKPYEVVDEQLLAFLQDNDLPGIVLQEEEVRIYPEKSLASHLLGFLGHDGVTSAGRYGIEGFFDENLAGDFGWLAAEQDISGGFIGVGQRNFTAPRDGDDIVLTIDRVVQSIIEEELKDGVERFAAERGSVVVMDPKTGAVLGMATYPSFDPNYYYAITAPEVQRNPVVAEQFEPGSILKPVVMAAAIEENLVEPDTTMIDNGPVQVADFKVDTFDGKHAGEITMTEALEDSNNVAMVWVGQQMGADMIYDYFRRFGLGEQSGVELAGEARALLPKPSDWNIATVATASFGQGVALTPIQALNSINVIANGGLLMQPYVVDERRPADREPVVTTPQSVRRVISGETAEKLSAMMVSVIENGVAGLAQVPGYYLAGKTGTAQVPDERGRYSDDEKIISFVGFGPVEDPQFSVLIKLDNPAGLSFASGTAAPMFSSISERLLTYWQIPPSYED